MLSLELRYFKPDEVRLYHEWMHDPEVLGPYVAAEHTSLKELEDDYAIDQWQSSRMRRWVLIGKDQQLTLVMGFGHCWEFDPYESHIEFGRVLLPEFRAKGYGLTFLRLLIDKVFSETGADRAQSITACDNIAVQKNWQDCGVVIEGRLREFMKLGDAYVDCFLGSVLRREWKNRSL